MENKKNTMYVACETEEIAKRYQELATKMVTDTVFLEKCKTCKTSEEMYQVYKDFGYTDLDYEEFEKVAGDTFQTLIEYSKEGRELTTEELESVVGGIRLINVIANAIEFIPVAGPFIAGCVRCYDDISKGRGIDGINNGILELARGVGGSIVDLATGFMSGGASWYVKLGWAACNTTVKAGAKYVTDAQRM